MFESILDKYKYIFIYEEQTYINSLGVYLLSYANSHNYTGKIKIFAIKDEYVPQGKKEEILALLKLDPMSITNEISSFIKSSNN